MMTVIVLSGVLAVTLGASEIVKLGLRMGRTQLNSSKAFFAAETAAEQVLQEVWKPGIDLQRPASSGGGPCVVDAWVNFDDGECGGVAACCVDTPKIYSLVDSNYGVIYNTDGYNKVFRAIGSSTDIQRIMEISYCVPDCTGKDCGVLDGCGTPCPTTCFSIPGCLAPAFGPSNNFTNYGDGPCCTALEECYECDSGYMWDGSDCIE